MCLLFFLVLDPMNRTTGVKAALENLPPLVLCVIKSTLVSYLLICYSFGLHFSFDLLTHAFLPGTTYLLIIMARSPPSKLLQEIIGHKDFSHHFKCKTQTHSLGFVEDFHGNSSSNHGSVEAVIKGNERGARCACVCGWVGGCLGVGG